MIIRFYDLSEEEKRQIAELESKTPDMATKTVINGFDGNTFIVVFVPLLQSAIEALGVIIAAKIALGTSEKSSKDNSKKVTPVDGKPVQKSRVVYIDEKGDETVINSISEYYQIYKRLINEK